MKNCALALKSSLIASLNTGIKKNEMWPSCSWIINPAGSYIHKAKEKKEKAFQSKEERVWDKSIYCSMQHTFSKVFLSGLLETQGWVLVLVLTCNTARQHPIFQTYPIFSPLLALCCRKQDLEFMACCLSSNSTSYIRTNSNARSDW